jgi:hypothetical protein
MRNLFLGVIIFFFFFSGNDVYSQEIGIGDAEMLVVRKRQWDIYGTLHTNGLGIGFRLSKSPTIRLVRGFDFEYTYYRHFKERKTRLDYSRSIVYGKLNYFGQIRAGYGFTRVLNTKPYWGGVEVGYFLYGGFSLGIAVPVYLKIVEDNKTVSQRYDPAKHTPTVIYGRDSFFSGLKDTKLHPGIYLKTGMSFDLAKDDALILKLDFGAAVDAYYPPVEKMAYAPKQYVLLTGFVTIHLGKRLSNYE